MNLRKPIGGSFLTAPSCQLFQNLGGVGVFNGLEDFQRRLGTLNGLGEIVHLFQYHGRIPQGAGFEPSVPNLAGNHQCLLKKLQTLAPLAQVLIGDSEVGKVGAFSKSAAGCSG